MSGEEDYADDFHETKQNLEEDYADDFHETKQKMEINVDSAPEIQVQKEFPLSCANSNSLPISRETTTTDHHRAQKQMNFNQAMMSENQQSDKYDSVAHTIQENEGSKERESNSRAELSASVAVFSQKSGNSQKTYGSVASRRPPAHRVADPGNVNIKSYLNKPTTSQSHAQIRQRVASRDNDAFSNSPTRSQAQPSSPKSSTLVSKLLRGFKLSHHAPKMGDFGYSSDIFRLSFLSHRERDDLCVALCLTPAEKQRMLNLFKIIEQLNPKQLIRRKLIQAGRQGSEVRVRRQSQGSRTRKKSPDNVFDTDKTKAFISEMQQENQNRPSLGGRSSSGQREPDLNALYQKLENNAKHAINEQFLTNVKSGRNHQSFHQALQNYENRSLDKKKTKNALNQIFPMTKYIKSKDMNATVNSIYAQKSAQRSSRNGSQPRINTSMGMPRPPLANASAQKSNRPRVSQGQKLPPTSTRSRASSNMNRQTEYEKYETPIKTSVQRSIFTQNRGHSRVRSSSQQKESTQIPLPRTGKETPVVQSSSTATKRSREGSNIGKGVDTGFFSKRKSSRGNRLSGPTIGANESSDYNFQTFDSSHKQLHSEPMQSVNQTDVNTSIIQPEANTIDVILMNSEEKGSIKQRPTSKRAERPSSKRESQNRGMPTFQTPTESIMEQKIVQEEAFNNLQSPLIDKDAKMDAMKYGYSFNSKYVAQGPTFFNLRIMCQCLGRALRRHCEFSKDTYWFLDELKENDELEESGFSYKFNSELKITATEEKIRERIQPQKGKQPDSDEGDLDERDENIDDLEIQLDAKELCQIEKIRKEQILKESFKSKPGNSFLHNQLQEKDKKIKQLTKMVQLYEQKGPSPQFAEVLAVSGNEQYDIDDFEDEEHKMTRAEFLMAQVDLDPIESQYSQEQMSSHHPNKNQDKNIRMVQQTMGNQSLHSVTQDISLKSSTGNLNASGSIGTSAVFKSPVKKPPMAMAKSHQKFFDHSNLEDMVSKKEKEKFDRLTQLTVLKDNLVYFDERYDFTSEVFNEDIQLLEPSAEDIAAYCKYVTIASKMENETPIIALVYIERLLKKTGILINKYNWKRFLLTTLCIASKVWDDDSLENVHFPKVMSDVTVNMVNQLEQTFLDCFLNYDLVVKGSEYAKYYFIMRTLADELKDQSQIPEQEKRRKKRDDWAEFPLQAPISADQMLNLQKNAARAEIYLKERYELKVIEALGDKFKAKEQKNRMQKFDATI